MCRKVLSVIQIVALLTGAILGSIYIRSSIKDLCEDNTPVWSVKALEMKKDTIIFDEHGQIIAQLCGDERRIPVKLNQIPKHTIYAVLATEDERFYQHHGIDFEAIIRASVKDLFLGKVVEGGSTITQQLVKNSILDSERTIKRKINEALIAIDMEQKLTKDEILELYLNKIYFGHGVYGIGTAALRYFDKEVENLTVAESAVLAGLIKNPTGYSPISNPEKAKQRSRVVLKLVHEQGYISLDEYNKALQEDYHIVDQDLMDKYQYPFFVDYIIDEAINTLGFSPTQLYQGGLRIYTTVNPMAQQIIEDCWQNQDNFPPDAKDGVEVQGAMVLLEPESGEIKGLIGGRDHLTKRGYNRAIHLRRQPGSTFKPIAAYGPALEEKYPPNLVMTDYPVSFGNYMPANYGNKNRGELYMYEALQFSVNVYAVKLLNKVGVDKGWEFAKKLGIQVLESDKGLSLALGGLTKGTSPLQMASAYSAFANSGKLIKPHGITAIYDCEGNCIFKANYKEKQVMSQQTAFLMTQMLQKVVKNGTGTRAQIKNCPVAGKTGTTQLPKTPEFKHIKSGNKDAWFVGYTPKLLGVVWMGFDRTDQNHYLPRVFGGTYPAMMWKKVVEQASSFEESQSFLGYQGELEYRKRVQIRKSKEVKQNDSSQSTESNTGM